ncbi:unnamed protein product [Phaeothamnion confervicola]
MARWLTGGMADGALPPVCTSVHGLKIRLSHRGSHGGLRFGFGRLSVDATTVAAAVTAASRAATRTAWIAASRPEVALVTFAESTLRTSKADFVVPDTTLLLVWDPLFQLGAVLQRRACGRLRDAQTRIK